MYGNKFHQVPTNDSIKYFVIDVRLATDTNTFTFSPSDIDQELIDLVRIT